MCSPRWSCGIRRPQVLRGVGAPRPPAFGASQQGRRRRAARRPPVAAPRSSPTSAAGNASGSRRARMAMYCAVHSPTPRQRAQARDRRFDVGRRSDRRVGIGQGRARQADRGPRARASGMPRARRSVAARRSGVGNDVRQTDPCRRRAAARRRAPTSRPASRARRLHGDLLAEHGAHRELEAVPGARHPQSRARRDERRQQRVRDEVRADRRRVGVQVEHPAHARDDRRQRRSFGNRIGDRERAARLDRVRPRPCHGRRRARSCGGRRRPRPPRRPDRARREEREHRRPVVRRAVAQAERDAGAGAARRRRGRCDAARSAGGRRAARNVSLKRRTLPKPAASATSRHRQPRLVDELLGEQHAPRLRDRDRRGAEVLLEQPAELPLADAEPLGQRVDVAVAVERAVCDQRQRPRHGVRRAAPRRRGRARVSGRQRRQGRKPASCAAAADGKNRQFSRFGVRAGQIGRQ